MRSFPVATEYSQKFLQKVTPFFFVILLIYILCMFHYYGDAEFAISMMPKAQELIFFTSMQLFCKGVSRHSTNLTFR